MLSRVLLVAATLFIAGCSATTGAGDALEGRVVRVVDGDTVHVQTGGMREKVRYIGVDTPETAAGTECFGRAASAFNARLVAGERVRLVLDAEGRDRYGRLLAYVVRARDGLDVNAELARRGYARTLSIEPNVRFARRYEQLAAGARDAGRGLWSEC